jgi:hypothetical protein
MNYLAAEHCKMNKNFTSSDYYSNTWMMSLPVDKWWYRITVGSGGRGKTYSGRKMVLKNFKNKGRRFVWLRLSGKAVDNLLQNNAMGLFPAELLSKYGLKVTTKANAIYLNEKLAGYVASLQDYYNNKGQEFNLNELPDYSLRKLSRDRKIANWANYDIIADELIREESERNTFNIKKAFQNQIENIVRTKRGVRVLIYANYLTEIRDIEELFDIKLISGKFGIYRNYNTRSVIEYLEDSKEWVSKQAVSYARVLNVDGGRFANKHVDENRLIIYNHMLRGSTIQFNLKMEGAIYTVKRWNNQLVICHYKGNENSKPTYALLPTFMTTKDQNYNKEIRLMLMEMFSRGKLSFTSHSTYLTYMKYNASR